MTTFLLANKKDYDILTALVGPGVNLPGHKRLITGYLRYQMGLTSTLVVSRVPLRERGHTANEALKYQVEAELRWLNGQLRLNTPLYQVMLHWASHACMGIAALIAPPLEALAILTEGTNLRPEPDPELVLLGLYAEALRRWVNAVTHMDEGRQRLDPATGLPALKQHTITLDSLLEILGRLFEEED